MMGENRSLFAAGRRKVTLMNPMERVSWHDVDGFARRLGIALPTETQWEYAARAGTDTAWWTGKERTSLNGKVNLADAAMAEATGGRVELLVIQTDLDDGYALHAPVGTFPPNAFGLHEVLGNVQEWCLDSYETPFDRGGSASGHAARGGSYYEDAVACKATSRVVLPADHRAAYVGVRLAKAIDM